MSAGEVVIIDYGVGNLLSIRRAIEFCGAKVKVSSNFEEIVTAKKIILPGVGAFRDAMESLHKLCLIEAIHELNILNTPLLGICLGMQLMMDESDEFGITSGLGLIPGRVISIPNKATNGERIKIPNVGWRELMPIGAQDQWGCSPLKNNQIGESVYFVHSFMVSPVDSDVIIAECTYGGHKIPAVLKKNQIVGCQFHPEKSGKAGLKIIESFINS
jgi:glutamine amidotransferase